MSKAPRHVHQLPVTVAEALSVVTDALTQLGEGQSMDVVIEAAQTRLEFLGAQHERNKWRRVGQQLTERGGPD